MMTVTSAAEEVMGWLIRQQLLMTAHEVGEVNLKMEAIKRWWRLRPGITGRQGVVTRFPSPIGADCERYVY